ncbi:MAG TPA: hypothetical protein DCQ24_03935 [Bacteroidales bacterium]|nr:hypothetical protein [Bacteroidales bacterium]
MMKNKIFNTVFFFLIIIITVIGCAKIVTPTGGPKDADPPKVISSKPGNFSTNFDSKDVSITFNEYIQLKDVNSTLVISPPMDEKPIIRVKGKSLNISFENELRDSTTYNMYFGNSLQDYNEGNPLENFQYIFSTGSFIDSLSIQGKVLNSFDLVPVEGVFVMLYSELSDSVPYKQIPNYLSKTNKEGLYRINNIRQGNYKLFCLKDNNKNYMFDINNEEIAFTDSLISFQLKTTIQTDTIYKDAFPDTVETGTKDEIKNQQKTIDTIITRTFNNYPINDYVFMLFTEDFEQQYLKNSLREEKQKLGFVLNRQAKDSVILRLNDFPEAKFIKESSFKADTFIYWLTDSAVYNRKELSCLFSYQKLDSNNVYFWSNDSVKLRYTEAKKSKNEQPDTSYNPSFNLKNNSTFDLNKKISFKVPSPVDFIDTSKIRLYSIIDSVETSLKYSIIPSENKNREYYFTTVLDENTSYRLELFSSAVKNIYGQVNDTLIYEFKTQKLDFYGKLLINISGINTGSNVIVQLIESGKEEKVIQQKTIAENKIVDFSYLPPKEFMIKLIFDANKNNSWDTGNYLKHLQPEDVLYYEAPVKIRSNWDVEINIDLSKRL